MPYKLKMEDFTAKTWLIIFVSFIVSLYILYLIIKSAVKDGTRDLLEELKKARPMDQPENVVTNSPLIGKQKTHWEGLAMAAVVIIIIVILVIFN